MGESELVLRRLLATPDRLHSLLMSPNKLERLSPALQSASLTCPVYVAPLEWISQIAGFHVHRGVLACGHRLAANALLPKVSLREVVDRKRCRLLLAEGITNVDNMGALFRNAAAFGIDGVMLDPSCCDPLYRKAIRVSMGHVLSLPYGVSEDWEGDLEWLVTAGGMKLVVAETHSEAVDVRSIPIPERMALVVGSEGSGVAESTCQKSHFVAKIPMSDSTTSLNVATAAAVMLFALTNH